MLKSNIKRALGFTLLEILLVVGFIAVAGIGIYSIYSKVQLSSAANIESKNIDLLRAGVKGLFAGNSDTTGLNNLVMNNGGLTPIPMKGTLPTDIKNTFGGVVIVAPAAIQFLGDGFGITYPAIPSGVCMALATGIGSQFDRLTINGVVVKAVGTTTVVNVATASTQCATDTGNGVTILFESLK